MISIYTEITRSHRLEYTFDFVFKDVMKIDWEIIDTPENAHLIYAETKGSNISKNSNAIVIQVDDQQILSEIEITKKKFHWTETNNQLILTGENHSEHYYFDVFSAIFFLISRYEEYLPFIPDEHGRFPLDQSIMHYHNAVETPWVDQWIHDLKEQLTSQFPSLKEAFGTKEYRFVPTYDIDMVYAYKSKRVFRNLAGLLRDLLFLKFGAVKQRILTLSGLQEDPYDQFDFMKATDEITGVKPIYFFLCALNKSEFDKNTSVLGDTIQYAVNKVKDHADIGIHPSYYSSEMNLYHSEMDVLLHSLPSRSKIEKSRQHYLRLTFPDTYKDLVREQILEDYTLGFAENPGFRAGTCTPFHWFDITNNCVSSLLCYPLVIMDTSMIVYKKMPAYEALKYYKYLIDQVRKYQGTFTMLWHNSSLTNQNNFSGYRDVYQDVMKYATGNEAMK